MYVYIIDILEGCVPRRCWRGASPGVHDEGAGGGDVAAEAEEGLERIAHVGAAVLAEAAGPPACHVVVALRTGGGDGGLQQGAMSACRKMLSREMERDGSEINLALFQYYVLATRSFAQFQRHCRAVLSRDLSTA